MDAEIIPIQERTIDGQDALLMALAPGSMIDD